jgi:hypothetical protein
VLTLGCVHRGRGQTFGAADLSVAQPALQALAADPAQGGRGLVAAQQDQRATVSQLQRALQRRENADELAAQAIDPSGAIGDKIGPAVGENPQLNDPFVLWSQDGQVTPHPSLVGDDRGILGIGLAGAAIASGGPVDGEAGYVDEPLAVIEQDVGPQGSHAVGDVDRPDDVLIKGQYVGEQLQQLWFVVRHPPGQQPIAVAVQHHRVVVRLADVRPRPDPGHRFLRSFDVQRASRQRPRRRGPTQRCTRRGSQLLISGRGRRETPGGQVDGTIEGNRLKAIPGVSGSLDLTTGPSNPVNKVGPFKTIKRQMYGRSSFRLLRTRILLRS